MSTFWSLWIICLTLVCLALVFWVLMANRKVAVTDDEEPENRTTGHVYDGIEEYDNPLPRWWFNLFIITFIFGFIYLIVYPGMGSWKGLIGWTSVGELQGDQAKAQETYAETFDVYAQTSIQELIYDNGAMKIGGRLFANNCAVCHGADGGGNYSFPNLTDDDWLWGGSPERIKESITHGLQNNMPAWGEILGETKVNQAAEYVLKISGQKHDEAAANAGATVFAETCVACHGVDGKGIQAMGSPNLTDDIWLYEGTKENIVYTIQYGRSNMMPAQKDLLREDKIHILSAYVYSLSFEYEQVFFLTYILGQVLLMCSRLVGLLEIYT